MIINQGNIVGVMVIPTKDQSPLIVDPNAEESVQVAFEWFQPIAWRHLQIRQTLRSVENIQFAQSGAANVGWKPRCSMRWPVVIEIFSGLVSK